MAFTTRANAVVNFEANTKELDQFYKTLKDNISQVSISDDLRSEFKALEVEMEQLFKQVGQIDPKDMTPDLAAEFTKKGQKLFKEAEKLNKKLLTEATNSTNSQIDILNDRINVLSTSIATRQKDLEDIDKKFPPMEEGGEAREFASAKAETMFTKELLEAEGSLERMKGASGEAINNFSQMWKNAGNISETFSEIDSVNKKINDGIEKGLSLTEIKNSFSKKEKEELEALLKERHKNFTLEEAMEQVQIRRSAELKKAQFLYEQQQEYSEINNSLELEQSELIAKKKKLQDEIAKAQSQSTPDQEKLLKLYEEFAQLITKGSAQGAASMRELHNETKRAAKGQRNFNDETKKSDNTLLKAGRQVFNYGIAFTALRRIYRETLRTIKDLDKALTEMAIVTAMNRKEAWQLIGTMQQLAKETGFTTTEIAKLSTIYFRQGRTLREVVELTRVAAQAARIAGISAAQSADFLTSAINAFQLSADQALAVSDRFAALAAQSASSYEELAVGLSKFAAQANIAGISIDFAMGLLAKGIETTREAPETIGTALKTVIARMRELTDLGKTFEDGMDISRVETALRQVGVALRDEQGQFRNLELVLTELGRKFETLNTNQQASVAVALAGTRQQSRLIAIMQDFDRTLELVDIAQESAGATMAQHTQFMKGMEAASIGLQTAYQKFITTITESEFIIGVVRALGSAIEAIANGFEKVGFAGQTSMIALTGLFATMRFGKTIIAGVSKLLGVQNILLGRKAFLDDLSAKKTAVLNAITTANAAISEFLTNVLFRQNIVIGINTVQTNKNTVSKIGNTIATIKNAVAHGALATLLKTKVIPAVILFAKALLTTPLGWISLAVVILIKGFRDLAKGSNTLSASFAKSFQAIGRVFKALFDAVWGLLKVVVPLVLIFTKFGAIIAFAPVIAKLVLVLGVLYISLNAIAIIFNLVSGAINFVLNGLKDLISKIPGVNKVLEGVKKLGEFFKNVGNIIADVVDKTARWSSIQSKTFGQLKKDLQEFRKESQAENFELLQKNRNLKKLVEEYEDIQKLRKEGLFGAAELERERALIQELENLEEGLLTRDGLEINIRATISNLEANIDENAQTISNNLRDIAEKAITLAQKDFTRFMTGEGRALEDVQNFLISTVDEDLTREQADALRKYYTDLLRERGKLNLRDFNNILNDNVIKQNTQTLINSVSEFNKVLTENAQSVGELRKTYNTMASSLNGSIAPAFRRSFQDIDIVFEMLNRQTSVVAERMETILDVIGFTPEALNALSKSLEGANVSLESFLNITGEMTEQIQAMNPLITETEAASQAIIRFAGTLTDGVAAARLYSLAVGRSLLEATQAADLLASRIDNLRDTQEKFLSGDLTNQELFDFVEQYSELFSDENFVDAFSRGLDLSVFLFEKSVEQAEEYRIQLFAVTQQLASVEQGIVEVTDAQKNALIAEQQRLMLLMDYQGALRGVTSTQLEYNNTLKAYNLLTRLGINAVDIQARKVENLQKNVGSALKLVSRDLETIEQSIGQILQRSGLDAADIYELVDGVIVLKDAYFKLGPEIRRALDIQLEFIEEGLEGIYSIFETLMNETLALEENMAQERIKVYEDYFAALDRLEKQRERQVERQDLVTQLARLEGATDERSRARALDIRRELNALDKKTSEETIQESRKSLIDSINQAVESIRDTFHQVFQEFISSGKTTGEALYNRLVKAGLASSSGGWEQIKTAFAVPKIEAPKLPALTFDEASIKAINKQISDLFHQLAITTDPAQAAQIGEEIALLREQRNTLYEIRNILKVAHNIPVNPNLPKGSSGGGGGSPDLSFADAESFPQNAKGGMVDYTGLSMLHGSPTKPEAVLNPSQTEMFVGLRDALQGMDIDSMSGGSVNIENISISTASLNNNQDFNRAGETLAESFRNAIQRKGITLNTNKI